MFNRENIKETIETIKTGLNFTAPYVEISQASFGYDGIYLAIAFEPKNEWSHGYIENSNYVRIAFYNNGIIKQFTCSLYEKNQPCTYETRLNKKFRKVTVKNLSQAIEKIKAYVVDVNNYYNS
jgi:hypothetical protein